MTLREQHQRRRVSPHAIGRSAHVSSQIDCMSRHGRFPETGPRQISVIVTAPWAGCVIFFLTILRENLPIRHFRLHRAESRYCDTLSGHNCKALAREGAENWCRRASFVTILRLGQLGGWINMRVISKQFIWCIGRIDVACVGTFASAQEVSNESGCRQNRLECLRRRQPQLNAGALSTPTETVNTRDGPCRGRESR